MCVCVPVCVFVFACARAYAAGNFSWPDWLSKHGLSPEQKSRDVQTAILLATILVDAGGNASADAAGSIYGAAGCARGVGSGCVGDGRDRTAEGGREKGRERARTRQCRRLHLRRRRVR